MSRGKLEHDRPRAPRTGAKRTLLRTIRDLPAYLKLLFGLMTDGAVSKVDRVLVVASIAYIISPLDFIPDLVPFMGQVDDVFLLVVALQRLVRRAGRSTVLRYWSGSARSLSDSALAQVVSAATFFLPGRTVSRLRRIGRRP